MIISGLVAIDDDELTLLEIHRVECIVLEFIEWLPAAGQGPEAVFISQLGDFAPGIVEHGQPGRTLVRIAMGAIDAQQHPVHPVGLGGCRRGELAQAQRPRPGNAHLHAGDLAGYLAHLDRGHALGQ
ncbi:hypothetical protein D3C81_1017070 [compost metagenome]